ncbi:hypothetical protein [Cellvibrio polysaccharolyticus]|uniref:Uncharacterized protein n=1 Tax=Cellvibrio polysaccharolyticus TaxID=2082724 RepID=A0A928V4V3_9GAMM|nr:hypothetical protein [Cellvibrio polysaccharolyticus]MBE8718297.1 hypothetical protein [Cellvibrio polysaccharolyticus]
MKFTESGIQILKRSTHTLYTFCVQHEIEETHVHMLTIKCCLNHLEAGNVEKSYAAYKKVPIGGMGCFNDRDIKPFFANETPGYVNGVFEVIIFYWWQCMESAVLKNN